MKQVLAYMNHGRWLARCPVHQFGNKLEVKPGGKFVPPCCHPNILAFIRDERSGRMIPDRSARATALRLAEQSGDVYEVVFPPNYAAIVEALQARPKEAQNWTPGESVELLGMENNAHGMDNP